MRHHQPRVFVTQKPKPNGKGWTPNLEPATQYGAIHYLFSSEDQPYTTPNRSMQQVIDSLEDEHFNQTKDYILWPNTGDPAGVFAVAAMLGRYYDHFTLLYWERKLVEGERSTTEGFYTPIRFDMRNIQ